MIGGHLFPYQRLTDRRHGSDAEANKNSAPQRQKANITETRS